jgi:hypothetical protein
MKSLSVESRLFCCFIYIFFDTCLFVSFLHIIWVSKTRQLKRNTKISNCWFNNSYLFYSRNSSSLLFKFQLIDHVWRHFLMYSFSRIRRNFVRRKILNSLSYLPFKFACWAFDCWEVWVFLWSLGKGNIE